MRIVKLQRTMICRSNFTVPLRLGLWLVACVGSCLVSRWSPGALAAGEGGCFDALFCCWDRSTKRTKRVREAREADNIEVADQNLFLQSIWDQFQFQASLPSSPYPGHLEMTAKQNSNLSVPPDPYWQQRWLCTDLVERSVRISTDRNTKKNIENIQNTISDDASLLLMSRCWHPLKGRFKAKEIQERVCFKTCHHLSQRERVRVSLLVPGQRFCRDCIFGHPCRTGLWWKPGHWKQHCMVAWHSAFRQGYTSHTHNISGCLEHVQREQVKNTPCHSVHKMFTEMDVVTFLWHVPLLHEAWVTQNVRKCQQQSFSVPGHRHEVWAVAAWCMAVAF